MSIHLISDRNAMNRGDAPNWNKLRLFLSGISAATNIDDLARGVGLEAKNYLNVFSGAGGVGFVDFQMKMAEKFENIAVPLSTPSTRYSYLIDGTSTIYGNPDLALQKLFFGQTLLHLMIKNALFEGSPKVNIHGLDIKSLLLNYADVTSSRSQFPGFRGVMAQMAKMAEEKRQSIIYQPSTLFMYPEALKQLIDDSNNGDKLIQILVTKFFLPEQTKLQVGLAKRTPLIPLNPYEYKIAPPGSDIAHLYDFSVVGAAVFKPELFTSDLDVKVGRDAAGSPIIEKLLPQILPLEATDSKMGFYSLIKLAAKNNLIGVTEVPPELIWAINDEVDLARFVERVTNGYRPAGLEVYPYFS